MAAARFAIGLVLYFCIAGVVYCYAIYPLVVFACARAFGRRRVAEPRPQTPLPSLSLLIAAYNEESVIQDRIENALSMDYPPHRLEIVISSDGSTDRTNDIVRSYAGRGVRLLESTARRGKATALNLAAHRLSGDIVLLSDANTHTDASAAQSLVRWFSDPTVGAVCGRLVLIDSASGKNADGLYWKYETFLKKQESRLGALLGSNGAIYAIRRELLEPIPGNTIVDDFVIPLLAKLRHGCQIIYDRDAVAREETALDVRREFHRRSRIGAGGYQAIGMLWQLLNPARGWIAFTFFSHKILRWLCPLLLIGALLSSAVLAEAPFYRMLLFAQLAFYGLSLAAAFLPRRMPCVRFARLGNMFVLMNAALFVGLVRWLRGPQTGVWARTDRVGELTAPPAVVPG